MADSGTDPDDRIQLDPPPKHEGLESSSVMAVNAMTDDGYFAPAETLPIGRATQGAAWTVFGFASRQILRFGFNLILTRLVAPRVFGVMALVNLFIQSLHMFSDLGIVQCVIHHRRGDDADFLNTAWTMQILRGGLLWALSIALGYPVAWFYQEPILAWLIPLVGFTALLDGLYATSLFTLNRQLIRGRLVMLELLAYLATMIFVVVFVAAAALHDAEGPNDPEVQVQQILIFVAGQIAAVVIQVGISYWLWPGHRHRFLLEPEARRELFHFGGWVFLSSACTFLASQADQLVMGKIGLDTLGVYRVASQLTAMPGLFIAALGAQLVFPLYSRLYEQRVEPARAVHSVHRSLILLSGWLASGLMIAGPTLVDCLYRGRYRDAGPFVQYLAVGVWFTMLQCSGEALLLAQGKTRYLAMSQSIKLAALVPLMLVGYELHGPPGMIIGYALAEAFRYAAILWAVQKLDVSFAGIDLLLTGVVIATCLAGFALTHGLLASHGPWIRFAAESLFVTLVWAAITAICWRRGLLGLRSALAPAPSP